MDERLLQRLMADAGDTPDQLPVLQHLLMRIWEMVTSRCRSAWRRTERAGGWTGALDRHLDDILTTFDSVQTDIARRVWQRLTEIGERSRDSRRPARMAELMAITGRTLAEVTDVIEPFRAEGRDFLVSADRPLREDSIVDISHESLIRRWQVLVGWARQEREWRDAYKEVESAALSPVSEPWKGPKLAAAIATRQAGQWTEAWARRYARGETEAERRESYARAIGFLVESQRFEDLRHRREKWIFRGVVAASIIFLTLTAISLYFWRQALAAERAAEASLERVFAGLREQVNSADGRLVFSAINYLAQERSVHQAVALVSDSNAKSNAWVASVAMALDEVREPARRGLMLQIRDLLAGRISAARGIEPPPTSTSDQRLNSRVRIAGGAFLMGDDGEAHRVTVSPFLIQEHEVTNADTNDSIPATILMPRRIFPSCW